MCGTPSVSCPRASPHRPTAIPPLRAHRRRFISARLKAVSRLHPSILRLAYRRYLRSYGDVTAGPQPSERVDGGQGHSGAADYGRRPQFTSRPFKQFCNSWGINHMVSSPHHHQANGAAEAAVKAVKTLYPKALRIATSTSMHSAPASWSSEIRRAPTVSALPNCCSAGPFDRRCWHILAIVHSSRSGATCATPLTRQPPLLRQKRGNDTANTRSLFQF